MKLALFIVGGVFFLIGAVWLLQGLDVIPRLIGSKLKDLVLGGLLTVIGVVLGFVALRTKRP